MRGTPLEDEEISIPGCLLRNRSRQQESGLDGDVFTGSPLVPFDYFRSLYKCITHFLKFQWKTLKKCVQCKGKTKQSLCRNRTHSWFPGTHQMLRLLNLMNLGLKATKEISETRQIQGYRCSSSLVSSLPVCYFIITQDWARGPCSGV